MLDREEYVEQAYFFRSLGERLRNDGVSQEVLDLIKEELLTTTRLPMALSFMAAEMRLHGVMAPAMRRLEHYFTPFQTFIVAEAEEERGRFDLHVGLQILEREALYRAADPTPQGLFLYQFECLCRNRLNYDAGLKAISEDPLYDEPWRDWLRKVRRQVGIIDICDMIYVRSVLYQQQQEARLAERDLDAPTSENGQPAAALFGEKEGRIALANRRKDPLYLFAAFHRQLGYPEVPRPKKVDENENMVPRLVRQVERLEHRLKLLEEEQRGGIRIERFFGSPETLPLPPSLGEP